MTEQPIYIPSRDLHSYMDDFRGVVNLQYGLKLRNYQELHHFSTTRPNDFWMSLWNYLPIVASIQPSMAVDETIPIDRFPEFYQGAKLNYAENVLSRPQNDEIAVAAFDEINLTDKPVEVSWNELRERTNIAAHAMRHYGVEKGDVVCVIGGSNPTSLILFLASASIGAVFSSFATDAGERVLLDRIGQLSPSLVFSDSSYSYNGKRHVILDKVEKVYNQVKKSPGAQLVATTPGELPSGWLPIQTFLQAADKSSKVLKFEQLSFTAPILVNFSSGTTGTPKGIIHTHGGLLVNGLKEHRLHYNHDEGSVHFHFSGIGWTLWNIMVNALLCGTKIVLYDGSPFYPTPEKALRGLLSSGITSFGAGPRYFAELQKANVNARPYTQKVEIIPSAGALLTPPTSLWIKSSFGPACQVSTAGGTELCGNFLHGLRTLPVYAGENAVKALGMDVDVFNGRGEPAALGENGELVCKKPFPNMPLGFLNDSDRKRYFTTYFSQFPHVWTHGDYLRINPKTGGLTISGRSDGVLNPSGIRFGSGDIYSILERAFKDDVTDAICVGQHREKDPSERVFLFVQLTKQRTMLPTELEDRIRNQIAKDLSRRHVPQYIISVQEIPYNVNGKKLEIPLKAILSEGEAAFARRKFTAEEKECLGQYVQYYEVESMASEIKAKL